MEISKITINKRKVIVESIPEDEGGGFEAYLEGARWSCNGCGETPEEAVKDLILYCVAEAKGDFVKANFN